MNSYNRTKTVYAISKELEKGKMVLDLDIQRKEDQWSKSKKSLLIMSMIQGYIIPSIFAKEVDKTLYILDGKQRASIIQEYLCDGFKLDKSILKCKDGDLYEGKKYSELDEETKDIIKATEITFHIYQDLTPEETEEIFFRLNNGQPLTASNIFRVQEGPEIRAFIDEAKVHPFMIEKANITKGKTNKSLDETAIMQALIIAAEYEVDDFTKKHMTRFIEQFRENYDQDVCDKVLKAMDYLNEITPEKAKCLKIVSIPMLVGAVASIVDDESRLKKFKGKYKKFLDKYNSFEGNERDRLDDEYLKYCLLNTTARANVQGRIEFFRKMTK